MKSVTKSEKNEDQFEKHMEQKHTIQNVFAAKPGLKAKTILMNTLEQNIKCFRFVIYNIPVIIIV